MLATIQFQIFYVPARLMCVKLSSEIKEPQFIYFFVKLSLISKKVHRRSLKTSGPERERKKQKFRQRVHSIMRFTVFTRFRVLLG